MEEDSGEVPGWHGRGADTITGTVQGMISGAGRRVLVTGGAGFVGSHVAEAHLALGDRVCVLDDLSSGHPGNVPAGADFVEMDVADPRTRAFVSEGRFDVVNHHAAQVDVRFSVADPAVDARTNIVGLVNVLEGARAAGTTRVVFVSSGGVVYGEPEVFPTPETAPKHPVSPYGVSKLTGEHYLDYYRVTHGLDYVALRYSNVYGPRQDPGGEAGVVAIFSNCLLRREPLVIYGDGEQLRDYVYVEDVARANLLAAEMDLVDDADMDSRAFNIGTGEATSVNTLAELLEEVSGIRVRRVLREARAGDVRCSTLATSRIRDRGWVPGFSLREGLARTYRHIAVQAKAPRVAGVGS